MSRRRMAVVRILIVGWLGLTVLGAASHTLVPGLLARDGWLVAVFPQLRWGHVMFNRMPRRFPLVRYRHPGETDFRPLAGLLRTGSLGYGDARAAMSTLTDPGLLADLCARSQRWDGIELVVQDYRIGARAEVVSTRSFRCDKGALIASTSDAVLPPL